MAKRTSGKKSDLSPSAIMDSVYAFREARVLLTAFELDLFSHLGDGWKSSEEAAHLAETNPRATDRLLNALCASGFLVKKKGKFSNTLHTSRFLVKGKPDYLGGLMHQVSLWKTWSTLTDAVQKGSSVIVHDPMVGSKVNWLEAFIAAMHMRAIHHAPAIIKLINLKGVKRVLDVGGGSGVFSMAFVRARKGITAVIYDLPNVINLTKKYIDAENLGSLISVVGGDYTVDPLVNGFDLVFMSAIIHSNSQEINKQLFRKAFEVLNPDGRLVVLDYIMNDDRTSPAAGAYFSLNMLVGTREGDTFTESEVRSWMDDAGFKKISKTKTQFGTELMTGIKKS
ncbi:MAG: methyltransferase [Bacteroidota bacterium]|jgi:ubiquinone/menaquinone biosynthesis C-methylase UbiE